MQYSDSGEPASVNFTAVIAGTERVRRGATVRIFQVFAMLERSFRGDVSFDIRNSKQWRQLDRLVITS